MRFLCCGGPMVRIRTGSVKLAPTVMSATGARFQELTKVDTLKRGKRSLGRALDSFRTE